MRNEEVYSVCGHFGIYGVSSATGSKKVMLDNLFRVFLLFKNKKMRNEEVYSVCRCFEYMELVAQPTLMLITFER